MKPRYLMIIICLLICDFVVSQNQDQNYVKTRTMLHETDTNKYLDIIQYMDGLGRPIQTVEKGITPMRKDLVSHQDYDSYGRASRSWLPVPISGDGGFANDPQSTAPTIYEDNCPYSKTVYDHSPLNRVTEQYGPGERWHTYSRASKIQYFCNKKSGDSKWICAKYTITAGNTLSRKGVYENGELFVEEITDEDGNLSYQFKNKTGLTILIRQLNADSNHDTYYVYDNLRRLCYVIPPMAADQLTTNSTWAFSNDIVHKYCYLYQYDKKDRCTRSKMPGCQWNYFVYDKANQLIFSQNPEQRMNNKWVFNKYDEQGRLILSGLHSNSKTQTQLATECENIIVREKLSPTSTWYRYSCNTLTAISPNEVHIVNFYDNHDMVSSSELQVYFRLAEGIGISTDQPAGFTCYRYTSTDGLLTAVLEFDNNRVCIPTVMYYDEHARMIQRRTHLLLGLHVEYIDYNFAGQPIKRLLKHAPANQTELYTYIYDHAGRLTETTHSLNGNSTVSLGKNTYDELGRLVETITNNNNDYKTTYTYNLRSWITGIKNQFFEDKYTYNLQNGTGYYNGNMYSKETINDSFLSLYKHIYTYDGLSRLTKADGRNAINATVAGSEYIYDKHGNVLHINRNNENNIPIDRLTIEYDGNQLKKVTNAITDKTLSTFKDYINKSTEYYFDYNGSMIEDLNKGVYSAYNLYTGMPQSTSVDNSLTKGHNAYNYTASGRKLEVKYYWTRDKLIQPITGLGFTIDDNSLPDKIINYEENMIFENRQLNKILIENGYIINGNYYFYLKDHLGNNRIVMNNSNGRMNQKTDYYPFGLPYTKIGYFENAQSFKFGGKEYDTTHGLNLYDFHARQQDPALAGRFTTMDPLMEKYYSMTPYGYCGGNPITRVDPDGRDWNITTSTDSLGNINYAITVNGVLYNNSSNSNINMIDLLNAIISQVNNAFTFSGEGFSVSMDLNLSVTSSVEDIKETDHVFQVVDGGILGKGVGGKADIGGLNIMLNEVLINEIMNDNNIRTAAHELGHTGGLRHPSTALKSSDKNLMSQTKTLGRAKTATQLTKKQIESIYNSFKQGNLNRRSPIQYYLSGFKLISNKLTAPMIAPTYNYYLNTNL